MATVIMECCILYLHKHNMKMFLCRIMQVAYRYWIYTQTASSWGNIKEITRFMSKDIKHSLPEQNPECICYKKGKTHKKRKSF
jgi:hypothetical protein